MIHLAPISGPCCPLQWRVPRRALRRMLSDPCVADQHASK